MKIAIFHLGFFFSGGGEKLVLEEAAGLTKRGHEVTLFAPVIDKEDCFPDLIKKVKIHALFFPFAFNFPLRDFLAITGSVFLTPFTFWRFAKFDVLFGANQPGALICFFLAQILKKPYVIYLAMPMRLLYPRKIDQEVGFGKGSFNIFFFLAQLFKPLVVFLDKISIQRANTILVNGDYMAGILEKVYGVKVIVCPAGCYPQKKLPDYQNRWQGQLKLNNKIISKPFILVTNRHFPQKRFDYAIRVLAEIKEEFPQVSLVITGASTPYTQELKRLIRKLGVEERVCFTGLVSEKELEVLYSQAVVYLYTSPEEDFGMGVIEAMAAGTPVVTWNCAGPTMTVKSGLTGFLAKPHELKDFKKKTLKLLRNPKLAAQFSQAGWRRSRQFSYQKHNQILETEIGKLL